MKVVLQFSLDQWGVELGKQLAARILLEFKDYNSVAAHDSSTNLLIKATKIRR